MAFVRSTAALAAPASCALVAVLVIAGCGGSPPHAAPANPVAEAGDGLVELSWNAVTGAKKYVILWTDVPSGELSNEIKDITTTTFTHTGLTNLRTHRYRIAAETGGGRGPESILVSAEPGPVPGEVEWAAVTSSNPGHTIHFATATEATSYRVYIGATEGQLAGRRPPAPFEVATSSPHQRPQVAVTAAAHYRVIAMNGPRIGFGGPVVVAPTFRVTTHDLPRVGAAIGDPNADECLDLVNATGNVTNDDCLGTITARNLTDAGLADLLAAGRTNGDSRFADLTGDLDEDLFSNTLSPASDAASRALMHVNDGNGDFVSNAGVTALGIGGFGGTVLAADLDNDSDIDLFLPHDHTQGDGARNWLLSNDGGGAFADVAAAGGVDTNPAGDAFVPRGGQAVDFNEDGFVDLLFGSRLLINDGDGTFSDGSAAAAMPVRADQGLKLIDVDIDGDLDLIHHDGAVTRLYRNGAGVFDGGTVINEDTTQATFGFGLNVCDINSDGFEDVIIASNVTATGTGVPKLLVNVNGELMPSAIQRETTAGTNDLVAHNDLMTCGDFDGSGVTDIVARWGQTYRLLLAASPLSTPLRIRVLGAGGERNQQGRVVRIAPRSFPNRIMARVVESGSGLRAQGQYDLLVGAPWAGTYDISVRFASGVVTATAEPGDSLTIFADGRVVEGLE
jgi:hypothetical protein